MLYLFEVELFSGSLRAIREGVIPIKVRNVTEFGFFQSEKIELEKKLTHSLKIVFWRQKPDSITLA